MIFGHSFDFENEFILKNEFHSSPSNPHAYSENKQIAIVEVVDFPYTEVFPTSTKWYDMSGQETRYHSEFSFNKANNNFSWALEIKDIVTLIWDASNKKIMYIKGKNYSPQRLRFWLYHTFLPLVLELQRKYRILHVGSVEIEGKPVLFSAPSFGGKSTMTDYFIQKGHTMLSDDSLGIEKRGEEYYAIASYPFYRPYREVETLGYPVKNFATESKPLHAVYLLDKSDPEEKVEIVELKGIEKFKAFHYSSFIDFSFMKKERFDFFAEMAKHVPVYQVKVPWDLERLDEVYEHIVQSV